MTKVVWLAWAAVVSAVASSMLACSGGNDSAAQAAPRRSTGTNQEQAVSDAGFDSTPSLDSGLGILTFSPDQSYSGYDGAHSFKVPIAVYDAADDLKVTADDPAAVTIAPAELAQPMKDDGTFDNGKYFMITIEKAGTVTLTAESHGQKAQGKITAQSSYTAASYATGETRYTTGGSNGDPPCTKCHAGSNGIDHSPAAMAGATDEKLGTVITTGISTAGFPIDEPTKGHRWTVTDDERKGLVTYLRGLEPRGFK